MAHTRSLPDGTELVLAEDQELVCRNGRYFVRHKRETFNEPFRYVFDGFFHMLGKLSNVTNVLAYLIEHQEYDRMYVNVSNKQIADDLQMSRAQVTRYLDELESLGFIERVQRGRFTVSPMLVWKGQIRSCKDARNERLQLENSDNGITNPTSLVHNPKLGDKLIYEDTNNVYNS